MSNRELIAEERRLRAELEESPIGPRMRTQALFERYRDGKLANGRWRERQLRRAEQVWEKDLRPHLPETIDAVKAEHINAALDAARARGLAPASVVQIRGLANGVFKAAVKGQLLRSNPVEATERPQVRNLVERPLTQEQAARLVAAAAGTPWHMPLAIAASTGMRRSEVLGLRWRSVDLDGARAQVVEGLHLHRGGRYAFEPTKTHRSRRAVPLPPGLVALLREHRKAQLERRVLVGPAWEDNDLVADDGIGRPLNPDSFSQFFKRSLVALGLPPETRLHDLRHSVASWLFEGGAHPLVATALLGHASTSFTLDRYTHWINDESIRPAIDRLDAALPQVP
jgi:integrase